MPINKKPAEIRIICLGNSSTYGWGVESLQTYPFHLQELLEGKSPGTYKVYNMGVPGYTSFQGKLLVREIREYSPDYIIVSFGSNDATVAGIEEKELYRRWNSVYGRMAESLSKLYLYKLLRSIIFKFYNPFNQMEKSDLVNRVSIKDYLANLREIINMSRIMKSRLYFLLINQEANYQSVFEKTAAYYQVQLINFPAIIESKRQTVLSNPEYAHFIEYYENLWGETEMEKNPEFLFRVDRTHPNSLGHYLIAQTIVRLIERN
jgi:lysophospholipase L1-like esterase